MRSKQTMDKTSDTDFKHASALVRTFLQERYQDKIPLAYVHTYGCQQNVSDGEKIKGMLADMGYGFTDDVRNANLILLNTCAVRENAEDRVLGVIGAMKHQRLQDEELVLGVCGCMVQQPHIAEKIRKSYPYVDLLFGPHVLRNLPQMLYEVLTGKKRVQDISDTADGVAEGLPIYRDQAFKAWLPIMNGCNNFCSYCIVPYVRGREKSRKSADILAEFRSLVDAGYKEITLLGQNVNSYGKGLDEDVNFAKLLRMLNDVPGDFRIRFMSSHPKDATFELIDTIAECGKVCKHFHLPVQCGSDRILKLMNRGYTVADYMRLIHYAKEKIPDISFTSDIIVGFPGETEEDFAGTLALLKEVQFDSLFSFIYSKRVGTKAASMEDPISSEEKSARFNRLIALEKEIGAARYQNFIGRTFRILVDGPGRSDPSCYSGRNDGYMIVDYDGKPEDIGKFITVKITKSLNWALFGERVSEE